VIPSFEYTVADGSAVVGSGLGSAAPVKNVVVENLFAGTYDVTVSWELEPTSMATTSFVIPACAFPAVPPTEAEVAVLWSACDPTVVSQTLLSVWHPVLGPAESFTWYLFEGAAVIRTGLFEVDGGEAALIGLNALAAGDYELTAFTFGPSALSASVAFTVPPCALPNDPADPVDPQAFYRWMRVGFSIFAAIADSHPRFRAGLVEGTAAEVFPEASAVLLEGRLRSAHEPKAQFRRRVLENGGIDTSTLTTVDALDAALAALTGTLALEGNFSTVGEPDEGVIVLPVSTLPQTKLLRPPPSATTHLRAELAGHHPACPRRESANAVALRRYADAFSLATTPSSSHDCVVSRRREWMRRPTYCALPGGQTTSSPETRGDRCGSFTN